MLLHEKKKDPFYIPCQSISHNYSHIIIHWVNVRAAVCLTGNWKIQCENTGPIKIFSTANWIVLMATKSTVFWSVNKNTYANAIGRWTWYSVWLYNFDWWWKTWHKAHLAGERDRARGNKNSREKKKTKINSNKNKNGTQLNEMEKKRFFFFCEINQLKIHKQNAKQFLN